MCVVLLNQLPRRYWSWSRLVLQISGLKNHYLKPIFGYYLGPGGHTESTLNELNVDVAITIEFSMLLYLLGYLMKE